MNQERNRIHVILWSILVVFVVGFGIQSFALFNLRDQIQSLEQSARAETGSIPPVADRSGQPPESTGPEALADDPLDLDDWDPFQEMERMEERMNRVFDDAFTRFEQSNRFGELALPRAFAPEVDVTEKPDRYIIQADIPGADDAEITVTVEEQQVIITGERTKVLEEQEDEPDASVIRRERKTGTFRRVLTLDEPLSPEGMVSELENGVLTVEVPKACGESKTQS